MQREGADSLSAIQTLPYHGQNVPQPADPAKEGYAFGGWYKDSALSEVYDFSTPVTADITLYAKWIDETITVTVTFETFGGSPVASQIVEAGQKASQPADPTKEGYYFDGWYKDSALSEAFDFDAPITADTTVYAKWKAVAYTVCFETNGGSAVENQTVENGQKAVKPADPEKEGFTFGGWYTDDTFAAEFDFDAPITADTTVYSKWNEITYTVTFDTSGGSAAEAATVGYGEAVLQPFDPTKEGYEFAGWYKDAELTEKYDFDAIVTADITIYAKWTESGSPGIPGDINMDGKVNNKDIVRLMKYLAGDDVAVNDAAIDVNGDGSVNNKDLIRLMKYIAGGDVEIFVKETA